ncbi:MAG: hypothetical protein ACR2IK_11140 [Chloroflexota bacterium]
MFASALDWPGWSRAGRDQDKALEALATAGPRYAMVASVAGVPFPAAQAFEVVERLPGSGSTEFGVPGAIGARDLEPLDAAEAERMCTLVQACWAVFDSIVAGSPAELRKGPRGGGRDRDKIVEHVLMAEVAYAVKLGLRLSPVKYGDAAAVSTFRQTVVETLQCPVAPDTSPPKGRWPARYAARRIAWHVLDHGWEIEDRASA